MPFFESQGLDIGYRSVGAGPAIVLIHGWGANGGEWESAGWVSLLATRRRVLVPDVRGHGTSSKPHDVRAYRMQALAADIVALLDAAGEPEADLFGYSMGAAIALWTTVAVPNRLRSLIVGGVAGGTPEETQALGRALRGTGPMTDRARDYRQYALETGETDLEALGACLETGLPLPPGPELAVFGGEALVVAGDGDRRRATTEAISGFLPGGRLLLLDRADHMGAFSDARFKQAAVEFLDEVSPT